MTRQERREQVRKAAGTILGFAVLILIWQFGAGLLRLPAYILPVPSAIALRFWETLAVQSHHLSVTATTTVIGLALSLVVGVLLALAVIYIKPLKGIVLPVLAAFNSIPKIAIAPLYMRAFPRRGRPAPATANPTSPRPRREPSMASRICRASGCTSPPPSRK